MLDWLIFCLGEIIGLIHALEKRYYQNKTRLRYNFGSVYKRILSNFDWLIYCKMWLNSIRWYLLFYLAFTQVKLSFHLDFFGEKDLIEPQRDKTSKISCAPSDDSDLRCALKMDSQWPSVSSCGQRKRRSNLSDDMSLRWTHRSFCWFCPAAAQLLYIFTVDRNLPINVIFLFCFDAKNFTPYKFSLNWCEKIQHDCICLKVK